MMKDGDELDEAALPRMVTFGCVPARRTLFRGSTKTSPVCMTTMHAQSESADTYWSLPFLLQDRPTEDS